MKRIPNVPLCRMSILFLIVFCIVFCNGPKKSFGQAGRLQSNTKHCMLKTNLRELIDAAGLALLANDTPSYLSLRAQVKIWRDHYNELLSKDPELKKTDKNMQRIFRANLAGRHTPRSQLQSQVAALPQNRIKRSLSFWLKNLLLGKNVRFASDIKHLDKKERSLVCQRTKAIRAVRDLSTWRLRTLLWRYRDDQVVHLFQKRDQRLIFLTPICLNAKKLSPKVKTAFTRTFRSLRNLKEQVKNNNRPGHDKHRTIKGILNGLRYMDTIHNAARLTGLDHRMMAGLYIQESEFIHHRVSVAGAFSVAQFLDIAIKDVWLFKKRIPGSKRLLQGVTSWQDLKQKMIEDPRMAIKASCLYFRRIRDIVAGKLRAKKPYPNELLDLLAIELFTTRRALMEDSRTQAANSLASGWQWIPAWPQASPLDQKESFEQQMESNIDEKLFEQRLNRLMAALGLASYNAGTGNMHAAAKRKNPFQGISFPLEIDETRSYVDGILDAWDILVQMDRIASDVEKLSYAQLVDLGLQACGNP
jgi:hypothetical protein